MKNQSGTIKTNLELDRVVMGVQVVTGDSQEEVIIFRDTQTDRHCIIIYISSSSSSSSSFHHHYQVFGAFFCMAMLMFPLVPVLRGSFDQSTLGQVATIIAIIAITWPKPDRLMQKKASFMFLSVIRTPPCIGIRSPPHSNRTPIDQSNLGQLQFKL